MALIECKEPVFDRQGNKVLALLDEGKEKEAMAEELGYSNPASLDNYMRRRNFAGNPEMENMYQLQKSILGKQETIFYN